MGAAELEPASARSHAELAALHSRLRGLLHAGRRRRGRVLVHGGTWDYDLDASLVAVDAGDDVGLCMLASAALRLDPVASASCGRRAARIGEQLMRAIDTGRGRVGSSSWLEVLVQNEPAIRLYEKLGYQVVRELEVWSLDGLVLREHEVASAPVADAVGRSPQRQPWQRADAAVERQDDARALVGGDGSLVYRSANGIASILQAAGDADAIRALVESLPEGTSASAI
jgi:hypothetical protein